MAWVEGASFGGGCDPSLSVSNAQAPRACDGGTTTVTFTVTDNCETLSETATFSVTPAPAVTLNAPADNTVDGCMTQAAIDAAFAAWIDGASFGGGCDPSLSVSSSPAPRACDGGSVTVTFTVTDICDTESATATFTVTPAPAVVVSAPADQTVDGCMDQAAIDAAFVAWASSASVSGGCDPSLSVGTAQAPRACDGGSVTVSFTGTDACGTASATATFTVSPAPALSINAPEPLSLEACLDQAAIDAAFVAWVSDASVSGGCDASLSVGTAQAPRACEGGSVTVTFTASDRCETGSVTSTFTVAADNIDPTINGVGGPIVIECGESFQFSSPTATDNCNVTPTLTFVDSGSLDDTCAGGQLTRVWTAVDACGNETTASQTVTLNPDNAGPTFTSVLPSDIIVGCDQIPAAPILEAMDCNGATVGFQESVDFITCGQAITRVWTATDACGNTNSHRQVITVECPVDGVVAANSGVDCNNPAGGSATATPLSGFAPYTYLWSNGATTASTSGLTEGQHTVTVTDASGCTITLTVTISGDTTPPTVSAAGGTITCGNPSVVLSATTNGTVTGWTGPNGFSSTLANPSVSAPGTYTVTAQNANGCTATATATVDSDMQAPTVTATGGTISCTQTSIQLSATTNGTIVNWSGPNGFTSTQASPLVSEAGEYTVTVESANGCTATATATVNANTDAPTVSATGGVITCESGSVTLSATTNGTIVSWTGPNGFTSSLASPSVSTAGTYTVTVQSANGCTATASTTVTEDTLLPTVTATGGVISCNSGSVTLSATTNGTVTGWTGPNGFSSSMANPTVSSPGVYTVTVTSANGCTATATATVTSDDQAPTVTATGGTITCIATSVVLSANTNGTITGWTGPNGFASSDASPSVSTAGTYTVTVQSANGCTATATATVSSDMQAPTVSATGGQVTCQSTSVTLGVTTNGSVVGWTGPNGFSSSLANPSVSTAGTYTVTVQGANGCTATASAEVTSDDQAPSVTAVGGVLTCTTTSVALSATTNGTIVSWTGPNGFTSTESSPSVSTAGTYTVTVQSANGCTATATATVTSDATAPTATATGGVITCASGSVTLGVTTNGTVIGWTGPNGFTSSAVNPVVSTAGTYTVTVQSANGCTATATATVTSDDSAPTATATGGQITCTVSSVTLGVTTNGTVVGWTGPNGFTSSDVNPVVSVAGTYTVTVQSANGCTATATAQVTEDATLPTVSATGGVISCDNPTVILTVTTNGTVVSWVGPNGFSSTTANPSVSAVGTYTVTVQSANGCTATATAQVTGDSTAPTVTATGGEITCTTASVTLGATTNGTITGWTGPNGFTSSAANPVVSAPGTYTVTVQSANGCTATATAVVTENLVQPDPVITTESICPGETFTWPVNSVTYDTPQTVTIPGDQCTADQVLNLVEGADCTPAVPGISLLKRTNGIDTDVDMTPVLLVGNDPVQVTWTYEVTNTGETDLTNVAVTDDQEGPVCTIASLPVGATEICTLTGTAIRGMYTNSATATGTDGTSTVSASDQSEYIGVFINVEKIADRTEVCPGEDVKYTLITRILGGAPGISIRNIRVEDTNLPNTLTSQSPEFMTSSDVGGDNMLTFMDGNGDGISDEEFVWMYTLTVNEDLVNIAEDFGDVFFNDVFIGEVGNSDQVTVTVNDELCPCDPITVELDQQQSTCESNNGGATVLSVTGGVEPFTYRWSTGATTRSISNLVPDTYSVVVTDANGCIGTARISVTSVGSVAQVTFGDIVPASCSAGDVGSVTAITSGGVAPFTYSWSNGATTRTISNLPAGNYSVRVTDANGCITNANVVIDLISDCDASIGDMVFEDLDRDGIMDPGEPGISGVTVELQDAAGNVLATTTTNVDGKYLFEGLEAGIYMIRFVSPDGFAVTLPNRGDDDEFDSDINMATGKTGMINLGPNDDIRSVDAGFYRTASLGNFVFLDENGNGIQDTGEIGVEGVVVELLDASMSRLASTVTDQDGLYTFNNLPPGDYFVRFVLPSGSTFTNALQGGNPALDSDAQGPLGKSDLISLSSGENNMTIDAGIIRACNLSINLNVREETCNVSGQPNMDGSIKAVVTGGVAPFTYAWSTGATTATIDNLSDGLYSVVVTDSQGCSVSAEAVVVRGQGCSTSDLIDLELIKRVNIATPQPGDIVTFQLTIFNNSQVDATGVTIEDAVPNGFVVRGSTINEGGQLVGDNIVRWSDVSIDGLSLIRVSFEAEVLTPEAGRSYRNVAQITAADQDDVDSAPNNDDGDQSEDDEDSVTAMPQMSDVAISKSVSDSNPEVGDVITYSIVVTNEGISPLTHVEVTDYLPGDFCVNYTNISDNGIFLGDRIIWTDVNLQPGESTTLSFDATVASRAFGQVVTNVAEVTDMDQTDVDSAPNNDDGDQSEDDESSADFSVGNAMADLELIKDVNRVEVSPNDEVEFSITLINQGPSTAQGVIVEDILPDGFANARLISDNGSRFSNRILWTVAELPVNEQITFTFTADVVHFVDRECDYRNLAQVKESHTIDPDATGGNIDLEVGPQEDDEDYAEVTLNLGNGICLNIETAVFLEGAFNRDDELMTNDLNRLGYLPGQQPQTFFGQFTPAGQPYNQAPWLHFGTEGDTFLQGDAPVTGRNANYPSTVVDWVLVSLRADVSASSTVGSAAALLHNDGSVEFIEGFGICGVDPAEDYFVVIEHRNHLIAMSHLQLPILNGTISYDFRAHNSYRRILGSGQKEITPGVYAMFAGNGDQSSAPFDSRDINPNDLTKFLIDNGLTSSYFLRDHNLSGDVNVGDKALFLINNGIFSDVPLD